MTLLLLSAALTFCNPIPAENMPIGVVCWHFNDGDRITPETPDGCYRWWYTTTNGVATARQYREMADPETHVWNGAWYLYSSCGLLWKSTDAGGTWSRIPAMDHDPDYAPTVERFRGKYYLTECFSSLKVADSPEGPFRELGKFDLATFQTDSKQRIRLGDPQLFADGDHLYLYWGLCETDLWGTELDPENPTKALKPAVKLCSMSPDRPWMRRPLEGVFVFKRGDTYYLLHSGNEAATHSYCMSVWKSKSPLGPYAPQAENPFFFATKPGMAYGGGHGSAWRDERGDWWINYTICPQGKGFHGFQRYIGQDRLEFAANGDIRLGHPTDEPQWLPSSGKKGPTGWKKLPLATAAEKAVDDEPYTYETLGELPSTTVFKLGCTCEINAFRLFWMDIGLDVHQGVRGGPYRYRVERRLKGEWTTWFDASANDRDLTADYREAPSATADAVRLVVVGAPKGLKPGLGEFTVFGKPLKSEALP